MRRRRSLATQATAVLAERLEQQSELFVSVHQLDSGPFFAKNGLLFQSESELAGLTEGLGQASPIIGALAGDPSLRGLTRALSFGLLGVQNGQLKLDDMVRPLSMAADTLDGVLAGSRSNFSWRVLLSGETPEAKDLRHFIEVQPVLDYAALEPGRAASNAIRKAAADLKLAEEYQARVRLTGPVAMADDEYSTVKEGAFVNATATILVVLLILWLALRSGAHHPCGFHQSVRRPRADRRSWPDDGRCVESDFDRVRGAVRRVGCGFRQSSSRSDTVPNVTRLMTCMGR